MLVTVFRSGLKPGLRDEYLTLVRRMIELASTMPGYISQKDFTAEDGERVNIVEFQHAEGLRAWRTNPEHIAAQKLARQKYYSEYHIQVCTLDRESKFKAVWRSVCCWRAVWGRSAGGFQRSRSQIDWGGPTAAA
jgi:heme-degrading monooxygenase HmoA